jgi:hypothetical protein
MTLPSVSLTEASNLPRRLLLAVELGSFRSTPRFVPCTMTVTRCLAPLGPGLRHLPCSLDAGHYGGFLTLVALPWPGLVRHYNDG